MSRTRVERNISYDEEKKKYYVNLDFGRDAHGHQIKKTRTFARLTDARKALRLHEVQRDFGALTKPNDTTVAEWLTYWMDAVVRPNRAATTVHGYSQMIVNHIIPQLGTIPLQSLSPQRIQQYYAYLCHDCGLSPNIARKHHDLLRNALRIAVMPATRLIASSRPSSSGPNRSFTMLARCAACWTRSRATSSSRSCIWLNISACAARKCADCSGRTWIFRAKPCVCTAPAPWPVRR